MIWTNNHALVGGLCFVWIAAYTQPLLYGAPSTTWSFFYEWDDGANFINNPVIQSIGWSNLYEMFTMCKINVYEPMGWLLKAFVYAAVGGLNAWAIRVMTLGLHYVATIGLAHTAAIILELHHRDKTKQSFTFKEFLPGCYLSAVLYSIHPIHVEVVAWPSAQPYALAACFSVLALYHHCQSLSRRLHLTQNISVVEEQHRVLFSPLRWYLSPREWLPTGTIVDLSTSSTNSRLQGFYALAVLSKSVCVLLPIGFVLLDILVYSRFLRYRPHIKVLHHYILHKLPILLVFIGSIALTLYFNHGGTHQDADVISLSPSERVIKALQTPVWMLRQVVWPVGLRPHYQLHEGTIHILNAGCLLSITVLVLSTVWLVMYIQECFVIVLALIWVVGMLLPTSGLVQHGMVALGADRYAYFPLMVAVPFGGYIVTQWLSEAKTKTVKDRISWLRVGTITMIAGVWICISSQQFEHLRTEDNMTRYSLQIDPSDWRILDVRSLYLMKQGCSTEDGPPGNHERCRPLWQLAHYYMPFTSLKGKLSRLKHEFLLGQHKEACEAFETLLESHAYSAQVQNNVGFCIVPYGRYEEARLRFTIASQAPGYESSHAAARENLQRLEEYIQNVQQSGSEGQKVPFYGALIW